MRYVLAARWKQWKVVLFFRAVELCREEDFVGAIFVTTNLEVRAYDAGIRSTVGNGNLSEFGAIVTDKQIRVRVTRFCVAKISFAAIEAPAH